MTSSDPEQPLMWFPFALSRPLEQMPPLALAYIGDAIHEVAVRQYLLSGKNLRPNYLHRLSTSYVSAGAQAKMLLYLEPQLTEEEASMTRQGRNAKSGTVPKNASVLDYRYATAWECLLGYLYYKGHQQRLLELITAGIQHLEQPPKP
ncbi:Mini-ribonuclease 3 [Paenibacillus campi]|uniref:Mini-ribonuclease 3 n=1 Tax=Paenibacillus campi TaxID=3106031 RepID=UPI002AFDF7C1|nr:ribonuclease III domain-containing protein [Paenibacillus sp. SGZ-1014]